MWPKRINKAVQVRRGRSDGDVDVRLKLTVVTQSEWVWAEIRPVASCGRSLWSMAMRREPPSVRCWSSAVVRDSPVRAKRPSNALSLLEAVFGQTRRQASALWWLAFLGHALAVRHNPAVFTFRDHVA